MIISLDIWSHIAQYALYDGCDNLMLTNKQIMYRICETPIDFDVHIYSAPRILAENMTCVKIAMEPIVSKRILIHNNIKFMTVEERCLFYEKYIPYMKHNGIFDDKMITDFCVALNTVQIDKLFKFSDRSRPVFGEHGKHIFKYFNSERKRLMKLIPVCPNVTYVNAFAFAVQLLRDKFPNIKYLSTDSRTINNLLKFGDGPFVRNITYVDMNLHLDFILKYHNQLKMRNIFVPINKESELLDKYPGCVSNLCMRKGVTNKIPECETIYYNVNDAPDVFIIDLRKKKIKKFIMYGHNNDGVRIITNGDIDVYRYNNY